MNNDSTSGNPPLVRPLPLANGTDGLSQIRGGKLEENQPSPKSWRRTVVLSVVALVTVAALVMGSFWGHYRWQHVVLDHATVQGRVYQIGSRLDGQVRSVGVEPGQQVVKGQLLIQLEDDHYVAAEHEAQAQLQSAEEKLTVGKLGITQARRQLTLALQHAENYCLISTGRLEAAISTRDMWEEQYAQTAALVKALIDSSSNLVVVTAQRDNARAQVKIAQGELTAAYCDRDIARSQLEGLSVQEAGLAVLASEVEVARQQLAMCQADLAATTIRAPADGWVIDRIVEPGGSAKVGEQMISLWLGAPWVEAWADEKKLAHIHIGSPVDVTIAAFPNRKFRGTVEGIGVLADTAIQAETDPQAKSVPDTLHSFFVPDSMVPIRIAVLDSTVRLQPGLSALVGIEKLPANAASEKIPGGNGQGIPLAAELQIQSKSKDRPN